MKIRTFIISGILLLSAILFSCTGKDINDKKVFSIAEQYGLAYAPLQIIRINSILEKKLPGWEIKWEKLVNTAAIREAMLSGNLDAGFMAIPPFLIGYGNGMHWKAFTGLSSVPVELITWKDSIKSLRDFKAGDRIALPQPGSIQHILLSMAAEKQLGNAKHFDNQLLTMAHPDGMNALIQKKDVSAHFTAPPFIMQELKIDGFKSILTGEEAAGGSFTFAIGAVTDGFSGANPQAVDALVKAIDEACSFLKSNPEKAAELLAAEYQSDKNDILEYITWKGMNYSTDISGTDLFIDFMKRSSYLKPDTDFSGIFLK
jgi:NitT/TauT family transport system substrate-binding protein